MSLLPKNVSFHSFLYQKDSISFLPHVIDTHAFLTIDQTVDYMAQGFLSFMRGIDTTRAIGRVGLKVKPVLGPEIWAQNRRVTFYPPMHVHVLHVL